MTRGLPVGSSIVITVEVAEKMEEVTAGQGRGGQKSLLFPRLLSFEAGICPKQAHYLIDQF